RDQSQPRGPGPRQQLPFGVLGCDGQGELHVPLLTADEGGAMTNERREGDDAVGLSRRELVTGGLAGLGAAALLGGHAASAQTAADVRWDHEYDVVVVGAGCAGLTAAIRARDLGASVLVVEAS